LEADVVGCTQVEVLGSYHLTSEEKKDINLETVVVAVRQANLMATAFHPEITHDPRW
jgi:glutamine amidotransferase PdxT